MFKFVLLPCAVSNCWIYSFKMLWFRRKLHFHLSSEVLSGKMRALFWEAGYEGKQNQGTLCRMLWWKSKLKFTEKWDRTKHRQSCNGEEVFFFLHGPEKNHKINHRIAWVGRCLQRSSNTTPLQWPGTLWVRSHCSEPCTIWQWMFEGQCNVLLNGECIVPSHSKFLGWEQSWSLK